MPGTSSAYTRNVYSFPAFTIVGAAAVRPYLPHYRVLRPFVITNIWVTAGIAPVGAALILDVNKNGVTLFTTQANRPTLAPASLITSALPDIVSLATGDLITVDVDQIGTTQVGNDIVVQIEGQLV